MRTVEEWAEIRRLYLAENVPIKEIARRLGLARNTVREAVRSCEPPRYVRTPRVSAVDAVEPAIRELLHAHPRMPATVIAARHRSFMTQQRRLHRARAKRWLGQTLTVLVDAQRDFGRFACRHYGQAAEVDGVTLVEAEGLRVGDWAKVRITAVDGYDLRGEAV